MISLDEQIEIFIAARGKSLGENVSNAILLSLRRLKRIEELMREPSGTMVEAGRDADHGNCTLSDLFKAMSAALLKQVEEEVK